MSKTHNHAYGELNARYRKILKKCMMLNLLVAGMLFSGGSLGQCSEITIVEGGGSQWANGHSYHIYENDTMNITGSLEERYDLGKTFIRAHNGGTATFSGTGEGYVVISNKNSALEITNIESGVTGTGGFFSSSGIMKDSSTNDLATFSWVNATNNGITANLNNANGAITLEGGVIDIKNKDESLSAGFVDLNVTDHVIFSENYIKLDNTNIGSNVKSIYAAGAAINNIGSAKIGNDVSFENNQIDIKNKKVQNSAKGGAVFNSGSMQIGNDDGGVVFSANTITAQNGYGGALYNENTHDLSGLNMQNVEITDNVLNITSEGFGGGLYNKTANGRLATLTNVNFTNNIINVETDEGAVKAYGGAVYNNGATDSSGVLRFVSGEAVFEGNKIVGGAENVDSRGGAIYNGIDGEISFSEDGDTRLAFVDNEANKGGAIYNDGGLIDIVSANATGLEFVSNQATSGGAIYNSGKMDITSQGTSNKIIFDGNTATEGGAIYNASNAEINFNLDYFGSLEFATSSDSIHNDGRMVVNGSPDSSMSLNADISGKGSLSADKLALNMVDSQIAGSQDIKFNNVKITLDGHSQLNLDNRDVLQNVEINNSADSVIKVTNNSKTSDYVFADTFTNSGKLDLVDNNTSHLQIGTYISDNGRISIDGLNNNSSSDRLVISDEAEGTTSIYVSRADHMTRNDRLTFAQINSEINADNYKFVIDDEDALYVIKLDDNVDGNFHKWSAYHDGEVKTSVLNYLILPRAMVEQTRDIRIDNSANNTDPRVRYEYKYGNKLRRVVDTNRKVSLFVNPIYRTFTFKNPSEIDGNLWGADLGVNADLTPDSKAGVFVSYRKGHYDDGGTSGEYYAQGKREMELSSTLLGLYYNRYFSNVYATGMAYVGEQKSRMVADGEQTASVKGIAVGLQAEGGYIQKLNTRQSITYSGKISYDYVKVDDLTDTSDRKVEFSDIHDIELEIGAKFEQRFNNEHQLPTSGYIKPSLVQLIDLGGDVKVKDVEFSDTLKNETAVRLEIGGEAALMPNFTVGGFGNYTIGSDYNGFAVGGNVRYTW